MELQCICGWAVRRREDLRVVDGVAGVKILRCGNRLCRLDEVCRVVGGGHGYVVGFSPMFSDWNLLRMGRDSLERELESLSAEIVGSMPKLGGKKVFRVVVRLR